MEMSLEIINCYGTNKLTAIKKYTDKYIKTHIKTSDNKKYWPQLRSRC